MQHHRMQTTDTMTIQTGVKIQNLPDKSFSANKQNSRVKLQFPATKQVHKPNTGENGRVGTSLLRGKISSPVLEVIYRYMFY